MMIDEWFLTIYGGSIVVLAIVHWSSIHMYRLCNTYPIHDRDLDTRNYYADISDLAAALGMLMLLVGLIGLLSFVLLITGGYFE